MSLQKEMTAHLAMIELYAQYPEVVGYLYRDQKRIKIYRYI